MNHLDLCTILFDKNGKPSARKITANPEVVAHITRLTEWLPAESGIAERIWNLHHGHTSYVKNCQRCSKHITAFRSWTDGYHATFCSKSCQRRVGVKPKLKISAEQKEINKNLAKTKRTETFLHRYGSTSNFSGQLKHKHVETSKEKFINRYSASRSDLVLLSDEYSGNRQPLEWACSKCSTKFTCSVFGKPTCPTCFTPNASAGQHEINAFIRSLGFTTRLNDRKICKNKYELDIFLPELNMCFEYDGLYWHSEQVRPNIKRESKQKYQFINALGITQYYIFEDEWKERKDLVKDKIRSVLIPYSYDEVKVISNSDARVFFQHSHPVFSIAIGGFIGSTLDSVLLLSRSRNCKNAQFEIAKCSKNIEPLWEYFIRNCSPKSVVVYDSNRWPTAFDRLGFADVALTRQKYFYVRNGKRADDKVGSSKVWDLGKTKWFWRSINI